MDEFIVNIGPDEDGTLRLIESIGDSKIRIIRIQWNPNLDLGGYLFAQQTNIAFFNCTGNWAFYLQADEVLHEMTYRQLWSVWKDISRTIASKD